MKRMAIGLRLASATPSVMQLLDVANGRGKHIPLLQLSRLTRGRPLKANPAYKGKWYAPMIDNPAYKGVWKPRLIPNPGFFEDLTPAKSLKKIVS